VKVQFTPLGRSQYLAAIAYIRRDNPAAAVRFHERASGALRRLETFPASGRIIPEFPELPYRELVIAPYRFFYRVREDWVWIVAVWHGAQEPAEPRP
jgi:toxin ParE1/3/4